VFQLGDHGHGQSARLRRAAGRGDSRRYTGVRPTTRHNLEIVEAMRRRLGIRRERVADDIIHAGNTSSGSITPRHVRMAEQGRHDAADTPACLIAFGAEAGHMPHR